MIEDDDAHLRPRHFVAYFCRNLHCGPREIVTRIEFRLVKRPEERS